MQNNLSVIVLEKNKTSAEVLESYLKSIDFVDEIKVYDNYNEGLETAKAGNYAVIMDISDDSAEIRDAVRNIRLYTSKIVITSSDYSTNTIIRALRAGAKEFLPKPVLKDDLMRVLSMLVNMSGECESSQSKIITVYSNKGGIGKTTIAVNLAAELAKAAKDKVVLVDLNLQLGDISTFLNLNPPFDVNYVIRKLVNNEETPLTDIFEKYKDSSLYVLSDPSYIEQSESITPQQITLLFEALRKKFPYIVVDMSSNIDANSLKILDCSDWVLFTTIVNIPAIRNAQRCLNLFRSRKYPKDKVKIIINRFMENDEIKPEDIENTLSEKIYHKIPNNYFTVMEAVNKGSTIAEINADSNIANSFRDLASHISDDIIEQAVICYRA